jgi:hypothetical protein
LTWQKGGAFCPSGLPPKDGEGDDLGNSLITPFVNQTLFGVSGEVRSKNNLTEPALLEMSGNATNQESASLCLNANAAQTQPEKPDSMRTARSGLGIPSVRKSTDARGRLRDGIFRIAVGPKMRPERRSKPCSSDFPSCNQLSRRTRLTTPQL